MGHVMDCKIVAVNYQNPTHADGLVHLLAHYAEGPSGGGQPLSDRCYEALPSQLSQRATAFSYLAAVEQQWVGLVNCFEGFSTFSCRPLVNIHDLIVLEKFRGRGIGTQLLQAVEMEAIARGCCKITLEVLERNQPACRCYQNFGFQGYELDPAMGRAIFLEKKLALPES